MTRWEYFILEVLILYPHDEIKQLGLLGQHGWELVSTKFGERTTKHYLKRQLPSDPTEP